MNNATKMIVESLLFVASEPLTARQIHAMIPEKDLEEIKQAVEELKAEYKK